VNVPPIDRSVPLPLPDSLEADAATAGLDPADWDGMRALGHRMVDDMMDYLRGVPNAPVKSVHEILERGLFDRALEDRFRTVDTVASWDSEAHRLTLARQGKLRARMQQLMDSLSLDALAYPTMRQKPTLVGEVQAGSTCNLSAQSGLPAISIPAGFSSEGLPIGIELMGRAFTDVRLVSIAYAFEQASKKRVPPSSVP